jgi:hypothetical protein
MSRRSFTPTFTFEFDEHGYPRARWSGPTDEAEPIPLLHFLESDLGFDKHYARQILDRGRETSSGSSKPWRTTGNAFSLFVGPTESIITPLFGHPRLPIELPTADLLDLVDRWLRLISSPTDNPDPQPAE